MNSRTTSMCLSPNHCFPLYLNKVIHDIYFILNKYKNNQSSSKDDTVQKNANKLEYISLFCTCTGISFSDACQVYGTKNTCLYYR